MSSKKDLHQKDEEGGIRAPFLIYSNVEIDISVNNAIGNYFNFLTTDEAKSQIQYDSSFHKLNNDLIVPIW